MPRLDGTGPNGQGPMTGRKMGKCNPNNQKNFNNFNNVNNVSKPMRGNRRNMGK